MKRTTIIRKHSLFVFSFVLFLSFLTACSLTEDTVSDEGLQVIYDAYPDLEGQPYSYERIKRIIDGDTFELDNNERVRLIGVNTPEITRGKNELFGEEAKQFAQSILEGQHVYLFADAGPTDRYGRWLRYVFIGDGSVPMMFNERLLYEGYANVMTVPPNVMYADHFVEVQREARSSERGLWGDSANEKTSNSTNEKTSNQTNNTSNKTSSCSEPTIKGNINSKGEKIYHVPDGRYYAITKAEEMFCTESEALDAGFRKAM